jgi:hypothetical protein
MIYSQLYLQNKIKVPTVIGFLFILFIILIFLRIFSGFSPPTSAVKKNIRRLEITNLSASLATIYWQTDKKEVGWLLYGSLPKQMTKVALDERDIASKKIPYFNHYVTIRNLGENQQYFFTIVGDNKLITNINNAPFSFTTTSSAKTTRNLNPAYGRVLEPNNTPLVGAVVLLSFRDSVIASTLTKSSGEWLIPLNLENPKPSEKIKIEIISEDNQISSITTNLTQVSPLPQTVIIGKNYNFGEENNVLSASPGFKEEPVGKEIDIIYPKEKALIPGRMPIIKGTAPPNTTVFIVIKSPKTYSAKVKTDKDGIWSFVPPENLALGEHIVTITTKDKEGKDIAIERKFTIIATEGVDASVLGEATPPAATVTPYQQPTPTVIASPSPSPPTSGSNFIIPGIAGVSLLILGLGVILAF